MLAHLAEIAQGLWSRIEEIRAFPTDSLHTPGALTCSTAYSAWDLTSTGLGLQGRIANLEVNDSESNRLFVKPKAVANPSNPTYRLHGSTIRDTQDEVGTIPRPRILSWLPHVGPNARLLLSVGSHILSPPMDISFAFKNNKTVRS